MESSEPEGRLAFGGSLSVSGGCVQRALFQQCSMRGVLSLPLCKAWYPCGNLSCASSLQRSWSGQRPEVGTGPQLLDNGPSECSTPPPAFYFF